MSRLKRKILISLEHLNKLERTAKLKSSSRLLYKKVLASWQPVNIKGPDLLKVLTDAMTYNSTIRINYKNSGWRSILPYGWNTSQDGNILVMCYKDTGEVRSYRLDRIFDLLIGDDLSQSLQHNQDESLTWKDFQMPTLPNIDDIIKETEDEVEEPLPYDDALKALTTNKVVKDKEKQTEYQDGEDLSNIDNLNINEQSNKDSSEEDFKDDLDDETDNESEEPDEEIEDEKESDEKKEKSDEEDFNLDDLNLEDLDFDFDEDDKKSKKGDGK